MPRLSKIGAAALAAFGWTGLSTVTASYLVVAGGGGGGGKWGGGGGGGGAGGYRTGTTTLNPTLSYAVTVGAGGAGVSSTTTTNGVSGSDSVFSTITSSGGGGGGTTTSAAGSSGGSGGGGATGYFNGGDPNGVGGSGNTPSTSPSQGNNGGTANSAGTPAGASVYFGGGGGGAGAVGGNASTSVAGNGGAGTASSISGSSVTYAGGGGGGAGRESGGASVTAGTGGSGGGGNGGAQAGGSNGTSNLGGGGGGAGYQTTASSGNGGSGVVIISYAGAQQFGGGIVTSVGGNTIHTFTTSGTLSPLSSLTASYLIVAGGGSGGGNVGGGGGAGGLLSGSGLTIDTNSIYLVTVGAGGAAVSGENGGNSGTSSSFSMVSTTAVGGGAGSARTGGANTGGSTGGSGGGGAGGSSGSLAGFAGTSGQGNTGGTGQNASTFSAGGGGGAGAVGSNASVSSGGNGGVGVSSSISGTATFYAGGGGGGASSGSSSAGTGGSGGGGNGTKTGTAATAGTANTGGGGGGGGDGTANQTGAAGGSGIVIISYPGSTPQMAGGTVTAAGGNIIHTFTSSGYLTPITNLNNSLRFRQSASAYLSRTPTVSGNQQRFTISFWMKYSALTSDNILLSFGTSTTFLLQFVDGGRQLYVGTQQIGVGNPWGGSIPPLIRDPASWYHFVIAIDTTQATAANRVLMYINGVAYTFSGTAPTQNYNAIQNPTTTWRIGSRVDGVQYTDGYMAEFNYIDGQQLTANSFGAFNGQGVWQPVRYGGSYGTNGFYLPFTNTTSTTTLGYDFSPNGNNWTTNNISLTAGVTYDSMRDVPTNTSATVANYPTLNPLSKSSSSNLSNGNLSWSSSAYNYQGATSTIALPSSGKWYWETVITTAGTATSDDLGIGVQALSFGTAPRDNGGAGGITDGAVIVSRRDSASRLVVNNSNVQTGNLYSFATNDIIQVAFDADSGKIWFGKNNSYFDASGGTTGNPGSGTNQVGTLTAGSSYLPVWDGYTNTYVFSINMGQRPFSYTAPSGFVALNTFNLPTPTIGATPATTANKYFDVSLYTGTNASLTITNSGSMQPDFIWTKVRSTSGQHVLNDSVRGADKTLWSNLTNAEQTNTAGTGITAFNSNGYTLGTQISGTGDTNGSGSTYVGWQWNAGGSTVTNTSGSISAQVRANTTAGFSIVTYTGNATSGATVGHGLGVTPSMVIVKSRSNGTTNWCVYHISVGNQYATLLNRTDASFSNSNYWNNTSPTSSVFSLGNGTDTNQSTGTYVAYCFAQVAGYSAFGSYTGNGSTDGVFIYTGFRPRFILYKNVNFAGTSWAMLDSSRNTYNVLNARLFADASDAENTATTPMDFTSNGFKVRSTNDGVNRNGDTIIYMAFAESPFKYANAR